MSELWRELRTVKDGAISELGQAAAEALLARVDSAIVEHGKAGERVRGPRVRANARMARLIQLRALAVCRLAALPVAEG
jgi:hypothetical protein